MNPLERSQIEKAGYDNGWEVVLESTPEKVVLCSSRHAAMATVCAAPVTGWLVYPGGQSLMDALALEECRDPASAAFTAHDLSHLARLLRRSAALARALPNQPEIRYQQKLQEELKTVTNTEVERLVRQRVGQDIFRESLVDYWGGACAVTGVDQSEVLRASHILPWTDCPTDADRLNVYNGLLLSAHLDALFDRGLISFDAAGNILISSKLSAANQHKLGLDSSMRLRSITDSHTVFLRHHWDAFGFSLTKDSQT